MICPYGGDRERPFPASQSDHRHKGRSVARQERRRREYVRRYWAPRVAPVGQWLFDMAALWVFLRAFGHSLDVDALIVAFGLANILAAIPITPGGLGVVEAVYLTTLVGFGVPAREATLGVASYRIAQYFFPIVLGASAYLSLRLGPWSVRDERLEAELLVDDRPSASRVDFLPDPRTERQPPTPDG